MAEKYKRIQDVEEKIHSVKLPYNAWKVFFLIDNEVSAPQISEYLEEEVSVVNEGLERLLKEGLVETIGSEEELPQTEEVQDEESGLDISMDMEPFDEPEESETESDSPEIESIDEDLESDLPELGLEDSIEDETRLDVDLSEDMPDFTEDLISVVGEDEEEQPSDDESLDELISEDLDIDEEVQMDLESEQAEPEIDIEGVDEDQSAEFDVSNLDVDFAEDMPEEPAPVQKKPEEKPKEAKVGSKTILVIDDSIVIRKMVEIALEDENFTIATAVSGKDGLALLDERNPDLIILDLMLPDINGIDLLKTVKASKGIPVIMLSGKDSPQMVEKARAEGADAFLPKPFKDDELVEKIKELVG